MTNGYANTDVLVSTDWVLAHLDDPSMKLVEIDIDNKAYDAGHIPGAIAFNWETELQDQLTRDLLSKESLEKLLGDAGIGRDDTIVIYGDHSNWFAAYGFWLLRMFGHEKLHLMNGGRAKWLAEEDKPFTVDVPVATTTRYAASGPDTSMRMRVNEVLAAVRERSHNLVDVRSPDEYSGAVIAPPGMSETAQRGGHIPGAVSVPWSTAVNTDGTFKTADELRRIYIDAAGVFDGRPTIAYCRIGERSSHTWFVLSELLGLEGVKNYDGSWTEYGSMVGVPIERGAPVAALR